ncbi:MAG: PAS domain S-box protein, partial [Armatimonadia bacterium]|nr:PAS domain S-box protein [Armatimonadia bacterium]
MSAETRSNTGAQAARKARAARLMRWLCVAVLCLLSAGYGWADERDRRVLVLHSYHEGFAWTNDVQRGIDTVFADAAVAIDVAIEHMDTKRHPADEVAGPLALLLEAKYDQWQPDVIISVDDDALQFLFDYRDDLFPGVPVVFAGLNVDDYDPDTLAGHEGYTGVVESLDLASTVDLVLQLQPGVQQLHCIHDRTTTGLADRQSLMELSREYQGRLQFVFPDQGRGLSEAELLRYLEGLESDCAVYFMGFFRDRLDHPLEMDDIIPAISKASPVPVYAPADAYMGFGVLGGKMLDGEVHGRSTAAKALAILHGTDVADLPVTIESSNCYLFDDRQLRRFGIASSTLPPSSTVLYRPEPPLHRYRAALTWGGAGMAGLLLFIAVLLVDRGRRRRMQRILADSEERYRLLAEHATDMISRHDMDGVYTYASPAAEGVLGYRPEELVGRSAYEFFHPDDTVTTSASHQRVREGAAVSTVTYRIRHADGHYVWVETTSRAVRDPITDEPEGIIAITREVTERKEAELALQASEREKNLILNSTAEMFAYYDLDLRVQWANQAAGDSVGERPEDLVGRYCYEIWHGRDEPCEVCPVKEARHTGQPQQAEVETPDGRQWMLRGYPVVDENGEVQALIEFGQDITERKRTEEARLAMEAEIQRAERLESLTVLAGGVAHDFNNLLTGIVGNVALAQDALHPGSALMPLLADVEAAADQAAKLARQMLAYSGRGQLQRARHDLSSVVRDALPLLEAATDKAAPLDARLDPHLPPVCVDATQISQVVMNLVHNAREAMGDQPEPIAVETGVLDVDEELLDEMVSTEHDLTPGRYVFLRVTDRGSGIPPDMRQRIFEPFYSSKFAGRGLGLAAVLGIVRGHH